MGWWGKGGGWVGGARPAEIFFEITSQKFLVTKPVKVAKPFAWNLHREIVSGTLEPPRRETTQAKKKF